MNIFAEFKIDAAIAGSNGGAPTDIHPVGWAPVLGTAVGWANFEVGEFFLHGTISNQTTISNFTRIVYNKGINADKLFAEGISGMGKRYS